MALLKKAQQVLLPLHSYSAEFRTTTTEFNATTRTVGKTVYEVARVTAFKPNLLRIEALPMKVDAKGNWSKTGDAPSNSIIACDGKTFWTESGSTYFGNPYKGPQQLAVDPAPWGGFFSADLSPYGLMTYARSYGQLLEARREGTETVGGVLCDKVYTRRRARGLNLRFKHEFEETWYIARDGVLRRYVMTSPDYSGVTKGNLSFDFVLQSIQANVPIANPEKFFTYIPSEGVKPFDRRQPNPRQ